MKNTDDHISLRPITADNVFAVIELSDTLRDGQQRFVAANAISLAQAYEDPQAWPRGIYCDDTPVGFLMLEDDPDKSQYFLWRLMIGGEFQGKGYGRRAIEQLVDSVRTRPGAAELLFSYEPGEGSPEKFYESLGFLPNGKMYDDEVGLMLSLAAKALPPPAKPPPLLWPIWPSTPS